MLLRQMIHMNFSEKSKKKKKKKKKSKFYHILIGKIGPRMHVPHSPKAIYLAYT